MEDILDKNAQGEIEGKQKTDPVVRVLKDRGELAFRRVPNQEKDLNQVKLTLIPASHKHYHKNSDIILMGGLDEYKIYQVKEGKIHYVSSHVCELPIDGGYRQEHTGNSSIMYIFTKSNLKKTEKNVKFFEEHNIEWEGISSILFSFEFGIGAPHVIKANYIREIKNSEDEYELMDNLDNFKPLLGSRLSVISKLSVNEVDKEYFLAELKPESPSKILTKSPKISNRKLDSENSIFICTITRKTKNTT